MKALASNRPVFTKLLFGVGFLSLALFGLLAFGGGRASAVTSWGPDGGDYTQGGNVWLEVSDPGFSNGLDAQVSAVTIYSYSPTPTVTIWDPDHCSSNGRDSSGAVPASYDTTFVFGGAAQLFPNGSSGGHNSVGCGTGTWDTVLNLSSTVNIGGNTFYVATLTATVLNGTYGVNAFKVSTNSGFVSFRTPDRKFALQARDLSRSQGSYNYGDFYIKFGTDCGITAPYQTWLSSFDDDQGDPAQDNGGAYSSPISYDLVEFDPNGNPTGNNVHDDLGGYGGGRSRDILVTIRPGHTYQWVWHNVSSGNGIQFAIPAGTDQIYSVVKCNQPWSLSATAAANKASMFPGDTVRFSYNLRNNGPGTASFQYVTRVQEYIGGVPQPVWSWPVPNAIEGGLPAGASEVAYSIRDYTSPASASLTRVCSWIEYAGRSSTDGTPAASNQACTNISQPVPNCAAMNPIPATIEPANPFNIYASVTYQSQQAAFWTYQSGGRLYVKVTGPGGYNQDSGSAMDFGPPAAGDISGISPLFPRTGVSGSYTVTYGIRGGGIGNITCTAPVVPPIAIGYHPYFRVDSGDVSAGAGFTKADQTCTASTAAGIRGRNNGASGSPAFLGAGAQLGALALGAISGFATSTNEGGGSSGVGAGTGNGLTFANTPSLGSFGALPCTPDYASKALAEATSVTPLASGNVNLSSMSSGTYQVSSGNINVDGNLSQSTQITIVVTGGDAIITGDIKYGGYPDMTRAPQFRLIVTNGGNIRIKSNVGELHGAFIALPNTTVSPATGGTLSTCYDTGAGADTVDYNTCKNKLTIYGAVVANTLLLERTFGSLIANATEGVVVQPAETFNDTPELWAAPGSPMSSTGIQVYDSVVSLPPVL